MNRLPDLQFVLMRMVQVGINGRIIALKHLRVILQNYTGYWQK